jgi:ATP-dependent Lon protease
MKERQRNSVDKNARSYITKEDMKSIHRVLEAQQEFEEEVSHKTQRLEE